MAALLGPISRGPELIELRNVSAAELSPLLLEESVEWERRLFWDFSRSADLVRRFTDMKALDGAVLVDRGELIGYGYSVLEDHKGLIGDLYLRPFWREGEHELRLFRYLLDTLTAMPMVRRVESQLMTVDRVTAKALQRERFVKIFERMLMILDPQECALLPPRWVARPTRIEPWNDIHQDVAASIISLAYHHHVDSQINDQYRSLAGARRFLNNIVQFPGCGMFYAPASFLAVDLETNWASGVVLSSFIASDTAHITQLCVTPLAQRSGLGHELMRLALEALVRDGARRISLTVTLENQEAVRLYQKAGFEDVHRFFAYVWEAR